MSGRFPRPISRTSRKPRVVTSAVCGALALGQRVDDDRRPVDQVLDARERDVAGGQAGEHALGEAGRGRGRLRDADVTRLGVEDDQVREGAADVGRCNEAHRAGSPKPCAKRGRRFVVDAAEAPSTRRRRRSEPVLPDIAVEHVGEHERRLSLEWVAVATACSGHNADTITRLERRCARRGLAGAACHRASRTRGSYSSPPARRRAPRAALPAADASVTRGLLDIEQPVLAKTPKPTAMPAGPRVSLDVELVALDVDREAGLDDLDREVVRVAVGRCDQRALAVLVPPAPQPPTLGSARTKTSPVGLGADDVADDRLA